MLNKNDLSQQLTDNAQEGIIILDREIRYVVWNPFLEQLSGVREVDIIGKHPWDVFPFIRENGIDKIFMRALAGETIHLPDIFSSGGPGATAGRRAWTSGIFTPLRNIEGEISGVLVTVRDVTERKLAEDKLKAAELRFRMLIEHSHEAVVLLDASANKLYASPGVKRLLGYTVEEFMQFSAFTLIHPDDVQNVKAMFSQVLRTPDKLTTTTFRALKKDGGWIWSEAVATNLLDVAGVNAVVTNIADITPRKEAEEERAKLEAQIQHAQRLESLGVLAGGIAHDFNNLLVGILGNADLSLLDLAPQAPARSRVEDIRTAGIRASELTKQMLAYAGKGRFVVEPLSLNDVIREMGHLLLASISKKALLRYDLADATPIIDADSAQIRQIVMNLLINASEALGEESGVITLSTGLVHADTSYLSGMFMKERLPEGNYAFVEVSDTGCGMDKETKDKIFDPFFSTKFTGRGLGLSAVLGIVRGHNGAIKVYSESGKGTSFKLLFPASARAVVPRKNKAELSAPQPPGTGTILVIDDEDILREVVKHALEKHGFTVRTANDGKQGIEVFREFSGEIAAVILDMTMPKMSGEETFRELRRIRPGVRVLLTSGYNEQDTTSRFAGKGLAGFIQKPFLVAALIEKVRDTLRL